MSICKAQQGQVDFLVTMDAVCGSAPKILVDFESAFKERQKMPGTCEANGGREALVQVLAELLTRSLPEGFAQALAIGALHPCPNPEFRGEMRKAFKAVVQDHPESVRWFLDTVSTRHLPEREALAGLFRLYAQNREVFPY
jgi:hypothetical protein